MPLLGSGIGGEQMAIYDDSEFDQVMFAGNTEFALNVYAWLRERSGNLFFSPYSISSALAMASAGARGETKSGIARVLRLPPDPGRVHAGFAGLNKGLNGELHTRSY